MGILRKLFFENALLPGGWAKNVGVEVRGGVICAVRSGIQPSGYEHIAGIALPGLANVHSHTFQRAMAGLAEIRGPHGDSFWTWREVMFRFLQDLTPDDVESIAAQAFLEMLEGGFTAVAEFHYLHHDRDGNPFRNLAELSERIVSAAASTGIGLTLLPSLYANGNFGGTAPQQAQRRFLNSPERFLRIHEGARKAAATLPDCVVGIAPHSLRAVTPEALYEILTATPFGPVHIHAAEQLKEVNDCLAWSGSRPVEWLLENANLDQRWCVVHATHMTEGEVRALARTGAIAGLCPLSEANLGDGIFEYARYTDHGGAYGVGSDSNVEINAPGELKQLEYSQRLKHHQRNIAPRCDGESTGRHLYERALAGGARATGQKIGAIANGYRADVVVLDRTHIDLVMLEDDRWLDSYVFVSARSAIDRVIVGGRDLVIGGRHHARDWIAARYSRTLAQLATQ